MGSGVDLAFDMVNDLAEGILYPGAGMDSPFDETFVCRLRGGVYVAAGALNRIEGTLLLQCCRSRVGQLLFTPCRGHGDARPGHFGHSRWQAGRTAKFRGGRGANRRWLSIEQPQCHGIYAMIPMLEAENLARAAFLMWPEVKIAQTGLSYRRRPCRPRPC